VHNVVINLAGCVDPDAGFQRSSFLVATTNVTGQVGLHAKRLMTQFCKQICLRWLLPAF
jgi:hypothetical protein